MRSGVQARPRQSEHPEHRVALPTGKASTREEYQKLILIEAASEEMEKAQYSKD